MPLFHYQAKDQQGKLVKGVIDALNIDRAADALQERGLVVVAIVPKGKSRGLQMEIEWLNRVRIKDLVIFSRQLSVLVAADVPIVPALQTLVQQTSNARLRQAISDIADDVEGGATLSQGFERFPKIFPDFYVSIVRSGERAGKLDEVLLYLADQQEKDYDLTTKVRGAMIYPIFIILGLIVIGIVMMIYVIPQLTKVLLESDIPLPFTTRLLIGTSDFMIAWWKLLIVFAVIAFILFRIALRSPNGRYLWDGIKLRIPIFGLLIQHMTIVRFLRSLATLLQGGVPLPQSLEIVSDIAGNAVYEKTIRDAIREVRDGTSLAKAMEGKPFIPRMVTQMFVVGERTGKLDHILSTLANFYTREVDNRVTNLVSLLEPLIIVFMGIAVGAMVSAILLPIYNLAGAL